MTQFFTQVRTSRKTRQCERCHKPITPGERYARHSAPPGGELGNLGWWHIIEHPADQCPEAASPR